MLSSFISLTVLLHYFVNMGQSYSYICKIFFLNEYNVSSDT